MPHDGSHLICKKHEVARYYSFKFKEWCCEECDVE